MRRAARTDRNHLEIIAALRKVGATVRSLASVGAGCPDLLVGYHGQNFALEVKDGRKKPSARKLTEDEERFFRDWKGQAAVVSSVDEALRAIGAISSPARDFEAMVDELTFPEGGKR